MAADVVLEALTGKRADWALRRDTVATKLATPERDLEHLDDMIQLGVLPATLAAVGPGVGSHPAADGAGRVCLPAATDI